MIVKSHYTLSTIIAKELKNSGVTLNKKHFAFGSIKPDISKMIRQHPHKILLSLDFVFEKINELCALALVEENLKEFSLKLGVVCHYITDFFTFAHNKEFSGTLRKHLQYEAKLNYYIKTFQQEREKAISMVFCAPSIDAFKSYLLKMHQNYSELAVTYSRDFSFALTMCLSACSTIISLNVANKAFTPQTIAL